MEYAAQGITFPVLTDAHVQQTFEISFMIKSLKFSVKTLDLLADKVI